MKKIVTTLLVLTSLFFIGCSSPDDNPPSQPPVNMEEGQGGEEEETPMQEEEEETSGADLLFNDTAVMATEDARIPYIFYNTEGTETAAIDENADGILDKIILKDDDLETVIEMNVETGLPSKMYTSEGLLVIYSFRENNSTMDVAVVQANEEVSYIENVDISDFTLAAKNAGIDNSVVCNPLRPTLISMANGYKWALGGWCRIKEDNNVVFQAFNIARRECQDVYRSMFPCCQISVYEDVYCKQLPNQVKVLGEIELLKECAADGTLDDCITNGLTKVQDVVNAANMLQNEIGDELILEAENALLGLVENNPAGNDALVGKWFLERQEELFEGNIDQTLVNVEYCDDPPNENECLTITEATMEFKADGSLIAILTEIETFKNTNPVTINTILEKEEGRWSYNEQTNELLIVLESYEYLENGEIDEASTYEENEIVDVESFTVSETDLSIVFDIVDNDADGIAEESYTEFYKKE